MITMQFDPRTRRVSVETGDKAVSCTPEQVSSLDSDLRDCCARAMADPTRKFTVQTHKQRSSIAAYRAR